MTSAELAGRHILITGAAGDIGRAVAELAAERGARLALTDREQAAAALEVTAQACRAVGATVITRPLDVTDPGAVVSMIDAVVASEGPIDGLVNSAGVQGPFGNLLDHGHDDFDEVLRVNVTGSFAVLQAVARTMVASAVSGSIVNLASMAGVTGAPNMGAYSASKAAVIGLSKSAARDLAPHNIRVNAVSPAFIGPGAMWDRQVQLQAETESQYFADDPSTVADQMINAVPMRRYGSLLEVAEVIAFLLSDRSSYMTATNTEIAGGAA